MTEGKWHKKVRKEIFEKLKKLKFPVYSSHSEVSKLELFRSEVKRKNCLSDADIVVFDSENKKIQQIIEIENAINPKKIIGIVLATHFCDYCRIMEENYPLKNILLKIIFRKPKEKSKKPLKLDVIKKPLEDITKNTKGCLSKFELEEHI
jgi:predicted nucleotidyltransferase